LTLEKLASVGKGSVTEIVFPFNVIPVPAIKLCWYPVMDDALITDTLHVLILAFGLIKLFAKTEEGVSISPPNWAKFVSVCNIRGHSPFTFAQLSEFVPPLRKNILLPFICIIPERASVSFKVIVGEFPVRTKPLLCPFALPISTLPLESIVEVFKVLVFTLEKLALVGSGSSAEEIVLPVIVMFVPAISVF